VVEQQRKKEFTLQKYFAATLKEATKPKTWRLVLNALLGS
jgi:hypothetical protein